MGRPCRAAQPAAGVESDRDMMSICPARAPKKGLVVGAGPAGLEAARVAAFRGHHVTVWEVGTRAGRRLAASAYIAEVAGVIGACKDLAESGASLSPTNGATGGYPGLGSRALVLATEQKRQTCFPGKRLVAMRRGRQ